ncbi:potassium transporter TrkG [Streptomyces glaucosporus]|uniref:Potassium transporter TrkG n=1 Tax=Streptomyces glaucosporus TaxID=284044 RepID=A0ABN3HU44_9ACTN
MSGIGGGQARPAGLGAAGTRFRHPARLVVAGFAVAAAVGAALLSLPAAAESGERTDVVDAVFTATSAVCLTGLVTVDTGSHWSAFGEVVVLLLMQAGGLGIMTLAALFAVLVSGRLRLRAQLVAQTESRHLGMDDLRRMVPGIIRFGLVCEAAVAAVLTAVFLTRYDRPPGTALYQGVFHGVSAFNNAGFSTHRDSLASYAGDPWVCLPVAAAAVVGGLGFPVVFELVRSWRRPGDWSVLTRITVVLTVLLLALGTLVITAAEYTNPGTLGRLGEGEKWLAGFFASAAARSVGFNTVDVSAMGSESLLATDVLMFIGGGSAGTAGGIKVTTLGLLAFVVWAEMRGDPGARVGNRRVPEGNQRQALAIVLLGAGAVVVSTFAVLAMTDFSLDRVLFEVISAFATVGLSTGITAELPAAAKVLLTVLMFAGRLGPLTLATALALRERARRYDLPEERIIVG